MRGDFSHDSFDPARHFACVLLQRGRVLTDAGFNEQAAIQQHLLRSFVVDLVGRRWRVGDGFATGGATADDFTIGAGRCWLGGLPFEGAALYIKFTKDKDGFYLLISLKQRTKDRARASRA